MDEKSKPKFSDVVGGLVSGVAQARSIADVEALRMAHRYRQIELLKGLPVPRLRLRRVSISIPMLVSEVVPGEPCAHATKEELAAKAGTAATSAIGVIVKEARQDAEGKPPDQSKHFSEIALRVQKTFDEPFFVRSLTKRLEYRYQKLNIVSGAVPVPDTLIRDAAGEVTREMLRDALTYIVRHIPLETRDDEKSDGVRESEIEERTKYFFDQSIVEWAIEKVRNEAESAAIKEPTVPPDFYVSVDTETIKNAGGGPNTVTRFNMVLLEEGLEWVTETHDGSETTKLMQE